MKNRISIVIPVYNTKYEYLEKCLNSIIQQTYQNIEVVVVNDGSTISYENIIKKYKNKVKFILQDNNGVSSARNVGLNHITGDFVMFVDADDWLPKRACQKFAEVISSDSKIDIIFSRNYINIDKNKTINYCAYDYSFYLTSKNELHDSIFLTNNVKYSCVDTPWAKVFRVNFLMENELKFNEILTNGEDGLFNYEAILKANKIFFLNSTTYNYRVNEYSTCNTYDCHLDQKFRNLILEYEKMFIKNKVKVDETNFDLYVLRIICRLLRKLYSRSQTLNEFQDSFEKILNDNVYMEYINNIEPNKLLDEQSHFVDMLINQQNNSLYLIAKLKIKVKI